MANITVTFTAIASGPFNLAKLFAGGTQTGVTITPTTPTKPPSKPNLLTVQADPGNGTAFIVVGDSQITSAGAPAGKRLAAGVIDAMQGPSTMPLVQRWITASANGAIANIEAYGGEQ